MNRSQKTITLICTVIVLASYFTLITSQPVVDRFVDEDGVFEWITAIGFFITSICFAVAFFRANKVENRPFYPLLRRLSYLGLALIFLFGAGEEISWGQRIFGLETPESWREVNVQEETNLHNLEIFQNDRYEIFNTDRLFALFWGTLMVGIPVLALLSSKLREWLNQIAPIFPLWLGFLFVFNYLFAKVAKSYLLASGSFQGAERSLAQSVVEVKEGVFGILFVVVGFYLVTAMVKAIRPHPQTESMVSQIAK